MGVRRYRDLTLLELPSGETLVTACDSCGGIGEKAGDVLACPPTIVGALTARVTLMELFCLGAEVVVVSDPLSCELAPTGEAVIRGIHGELRRAGLPADILSGSTEENFPTTMTGIGVVATGICQRTPRIGQVAAGDVALLIGKPLVGEAILAAGLDNLVSYDEVRTLLALADVLEMAPCGSKGAAHEGEEIARLNGLTWEVTIADTDLLTRSAGTASCLVAAVNAEVVEAIKSVIPHQPVTVIGRFQ